MSETAKRTQALPDGGEWEALFTAGPGMTIISTLRICNTFERIDHADVRIALAGEDSGSKQYVLYGAPIPPGLPYAITEGWTLLEGDVIWARSWSGGLAFNVFGVERS